MKSTDFLGLLLTVTVGESWSYSESHLPICYTSVVILLFPWLLWGLCLECVLRWYQLNNEIQENWHLPLARHSSPQVSHGKYVAGDNDTSTPQNENTFPLLGFGPGDSWSIEPSGEFLLRRIGQSKHERRRWHAAPCLSQQPVIGMVSPKDSLPPLWEQVLHPLLTRANIPLLA